MEPDAGGPASRPAHDEWAILNPSTQPHFRGLPRRTVLAGGVAAAAAFLAPGTARAACPQPAGGGATGAAAPLLGFEPIAPATDDAVGIAAGYTAAVLIPWGTPLLGSYPPFRPGANTPEEQAQQVGMHHDGMHFFPLDRLRQNTRGLLVLNHEFTDEARLQTGPTTLPAKQTWTAQMVRRSQAAVGVSVVEIARSGPGPRAQWQVVRSRYNRRITANTPMTFAGPATGHRLLRTKADPSGRRPLGTFNNCSNGVTPWGTYLTCEENVNEFFDVPEGTPLDAESAALVARYGIGGDKYFWATSDPRFVVTAEDPNEPNRHGWVVEIDPFRPSSTPVKRTALGRLKHEGAYVHVAEDGHVVVYMGDDQANEYVYKYVSAKPWRRMVKEGTSPLDEGTLYAARFDALGTGEWLALVQGEGPLTARNGFADQGDVLVKTRLAATLVGATPMDRPEWTTVDPVSGRVYVTLTNNTEPTKVANAANPRTPNTYGHIVGLDEHDGYTGTDFFWDLLLLAGGGASALDGSTVPDAAAFGSPDGVWADPRGRLWIQTDGTQPGGANNQMLVADTSRRDLLGTPDLRRFLTGPKGCEVTGITATPDGRTLFVNIQHPGEKGESTWPGGNRGEPASRADAVARSATLVITKDDGGIVGS
jgi:uncharacterized protein